MQAALPYAAVSLSASMLGASFVATRYVMPQTSPGTLGFVTFALALVALLPWVPTAFRHSGLTLRDALGMMGLGVLQFGIFYYLINWALEFIPASRGAVIFSLIPILTMAIAVGMRFEAWTLMRGLATLLSIVGVGLAIGEKAFAGGASASWAGELMFLAAVCCGATYNAFSSRYLVRYSPMALTILAVAGGLVFLTFFAAHEGGLGTLPRFDMWGWVAVLFLGIPRGAFGLVLFNYAVKRLSPTRAAIFVPLAPVMATGLGAWLLDEAISILFVIGLGCVVAGILLANRRPRPLPAAGAPARRPI